MSIRRAVEAHVKKVLDPYVPSVPNGWPHQVVESLRLEDRPMPAIIIVAGAAQLALDEFPDAYGNYRVPITVMVMSSIDDTTVDVHSELAHQVGRILQMPTSRGQSTIQGLYLYDIIPGSTGLDKEGRKLMSVLNYDSVVNYMPQQPL
jgi:hypothetical protein